ncbi:hypothetical protein GPECTOR_33g579 [Gonium pectorale]|uniref:Uncharacterized protein n=1 Tax=Gonium pectorale TaxID=33097 RepID=A0A150GCX4_GONPE|nr:hypothetical protein GPECTOR_33g579 [Gonium pectorale]|eukprot:KXZ47697.1 hypothetical protein GPECTOR_33g579 [Gonium pectorale]
MPSSVRPRNPNQKATWNELPLEVLKIICQRLDSSSVLSARRVAASMREACSEAPVVLRFTVPMQSSPWALMQVQAWEKRMAGAANLLATGKMRASELQLRMEGADTWKPPGDEAMPMSQIRSTASQLLSMLSSLDKLGSQTASPITHLDMELPCTIDVLNEVASHLTAITSLRLDSLIPPPHNHVQVLSEIGAFRLDNLRKLDLRVSAWDHLQHLADLTRLTELNVRYSMWNIPELSPLTMLQDLQTFGLEAEDDRARFQLDFLGPLVRGVPRLRNVSASIILSRTAASDSGAASCDFLAGCGLTSFSLDVRVPQDAARTVHAHFRNLHYAPRGCKIQLTIRADALMKETSYESAATRIGTIIAPRVGMAIPPQPEPLQRWGSLALSELGAHPADALTLLHLRGYRCRLRSLPDLSAARLTRLQISEARLGSSELASLAACTSLEHLFLRFAYQPPEPSPVPPATTSAARPPASGTGAVGATPCNGNQTGGEDGAAARRRRSKRSSSGAGPATDGPHTMMTRSRRSMFALSRRSSAAATPQPPPDCASVPAAYILQPLLQLHRLRSFELIEERDTPLPGAAAASAAAARALASNTGRTLNFSLPNAPAVSGSASSCNPAAAGPSVPPVPPPAPPPPPPKLPMSRSGLGHFLRELSRLPKMKALNVSLLAEEDELPDCPCQPCCFAAGPGVGPGHEPPAPLRDESLAELLGPMACYKVALGSVESKGSSWYRPSSWPSLEG